MLEEMTPWVYEILLYFAIYVRGHINSFTFADLISLMTFYENMVLLCLNEALKFKS